MQRSEHETSDLTGTSSCSKEDTINSTDNTTVPDCEIIKDPPTEGADGKSLTWNSTIESHVVGRAKEKEDIIKLISQQATEKFQVISIWGMGGLGKTTLVKDIYQSKELSDRFEKRACATILRPFSLVELLRSLAMQFYTETSEKKPVAGLPASTIKEKLPSMTVDQLINELATVVDRKRCLIVLDDVSSPAEWDQLIRPLLFQKMENTSRIIVTTRNESIALHCSENNKKKYTCSKIWNTSMHMSSSHKRYLISIFMLHLFDLIFLTSFCGEDCLFYNHGSYFA